MTKRRYWVTLRQSAHQQSRDVRPITAPTLTMAETIAQRHLRIARLVKVDGKAWDRWEVRTSGSPYAVPVLVAHGDQDGITYTVRSQGVWVD